MYAFKQIAKEDQHGFDNSTNGSTENQHTTELHPYKQFEEFKKIYLTAYILSVQKKRLMSSLTQNLQKIQKIQESLSQTVQENVGSEEDKKTQQDAIKRSRRKADDIQRKWECFEQYCGRKYGSHASLIQHVKLKHPQAASRYC